MKEQNEIDEFPLVTYEFEEAKRENFYNDIKRYVMAYNNEDGKEFPIQYNWIFDLVIKVNHLHFGRNKISILVAPIYSENDETSNLYGLIRTFISSFNFLKKELEFRSIEEVEQIVDEDRKRLENGYNDIIRQFSNEKNYKNKLRIELNNDFESNEDYERDFIDKYENFESGLETTFNGIRATSFFRGEVWLRFYKELSERLFDAKQMNRLQNNKPASDSPNISDTGFNIGYSDEQLTALHEKLTNTKESETDLTEDQTIIHNHVKHLGGDNSNREKIMTTENFNLLFKDLCYLVQNDSLPEITKPLPQMGVSNQSIIYTVRLIHKDIFTTTKVRPSFIEFLQKYFQQLSNVENMKVAFSKKMPKKYPY